MAQIHCKNCNAEFSDEALFCPMCGKPVEQDKEGVEMPSMQIEGNLSYDPKPKKKGKGLLIALIIIAVIAAVGIAVNHSRMLDEYYSTMIEASNTMLDGLVETEEAGGLIHDVWYNAIWDQNNKETYKYVKGTSDFNEALGNLYEDKKFIEKMESITSNQIEVLSLMKKLNDPPEKYEDAYRDLRELYELYLEFTTTAISPAGKNITEFTDDYSELSEKTAKSLATMQLHFE